MSLRIADLNWAFDSGSILTASSENSEFPVSNLTRYSRSKPWRSSGYFVITTGVNDAIDFDEGGGELNATIPQGSYSTSSLVSAIKSVLEIAGSELYTVTYNETSGLWTILSGGATFSLLWFSGTNSGNSVGSVIGFDISSDDTASLGYTGASIALHTEEWIQVDLGTWGTNEVDSFGLFFDPELGPQFTENVVIKLQGNQTQNFTSPTVDITLSLDEDWSVVTHFFAASEILRYWRVLVIDPKNPNLHVEIPTVVLASDLAISQAPEIGFSDALTDRTRIQANTFGNEFFDTLPGQRSADYAWKAITEDDKILFKQFYFRVGRIIPFMIVNDPTESTFQNKDESVMYCRLSNNYDAGQKFFTFFDFAMQVREAF